MKNSTFSRIITAVSAVLVTISASVMLQSVFAESAGNVRAGEIEFKHSDGSNAYSFETNEELTACCDITNDDEPKRFNLYIAMYESDSDTGRLISVTHSQREYAAGETARLSGVFDVPDNIEDNWCIKAFVFDDELRPYTKCESISLASKQDEYFTETDSVYRFFAPGVFRPDEGTIQFTVCPDRPSSELGNAYDMIFRIASAVDDSNASNSILALCIPQLSETRTEPTLQFVLKNKNGALYLEKPFSYGAEAVGKKFNIAVSWKAGGNMYMYVSDDTNVTYIGGAECPSGLNEETLSYFFSVDKEGPMHVSDIMVSSKQLYSGQISKVGTFAVNNDVTLLATDGLSKTTLNNSNWQKTSQYNTTIPAFRTEKQVYSEGEQVVYPVMSVNHSGEDKKYKIDIAVSDTENTALFSRSAEISVSADSKYHINEIPIRGITDPGLYKIHTRITAQDGTYREYNSNISIIPRPENIADGAFSDYYGHHVNYDTDISVFKKLNVSSARMWFNEFIWYNLEPVQGDWQWKRMDDYVDMLENADMEILGVLGYPSRWAAQEPTADEQDACLRWEYRPDRWKPSNIEQWENYVYTLVSRYKGRIKYWEVYNEVNFHPPYVPAAFSGSTEEYAELLRIAYAAAKRADPDCEIIISGFSPPSGAVDSAMPLEFAKSKYQSGYYDIYNVHGYSGAAAVSSWLSAYRTARPDIKAFMTEEFPYQQAENSDRAYAAVRLPIEFLAAGYDKYYHFGMFGQDGVFTVPYTLSPTEAYQASGVLQANLRKCDSYDGSVSGFSNSGLLNINAEFIRTDGKRLYVFGAADNTFNIYLKGSVVYCTDIYGRELDVEEQTDGSLMISSDNIMYVLTDGEPQIVRAEEADTGAIVKNGGFENLDGDVAAIGLSNCTPSNWVIRKLNSSGAADDSVGSVKLSTSGKNSGQYGLWIRSNDSTGKVYVYQDVAIPEAGTYKLTAKIRKNKDDGGLTPYMFFYDRDNSKSTPTVLNIQESGFTTQSVIITAAAPTKINAAVGIGIYSGIGEIYIDDISMEKLSDTVDVDALVANGGFEVLDGKNPAGWAIMKLNSTTGEPDENKVSTAASSGTKNTGAYSFWIRTNDLESRGYVSQDITIPAAGKYRLSAKVCRRTDYEGDFKPYLFIKNKDTGITENTFMSIDSSVPGYTFTEQTAEMTADGPVDVTIGIGIYSGKGQVYIDDVKIESITD